MYSPLGFRFHRVISFFHSFFSFSSFIQDRDKLQRQHLNDTVEELKRFNARRKLKGAVQAIASGVSLDPLCCTDIDSGKEKKSPRRIFSFHAFFFY